MKQGIIAGLLALIIVGCVPPDPEANLEDNLYYPLDKVLDSQEKQWETDTPASITKTIIMEDSEEVKVQTIEDAKGVLGFIEDNDLNLPAYRGLYNSTVNKAGENGKLMGKHYSLKDGEDAPVRLLNIYYYPDRKDSLAGIAGFRETFNPLYYTYQITTARFSDGRLRQAKILNRQKILLFSPTEFTVKLDIEY